ncbi:hypothetical protein CHS0354_027882 [Potamilus streckersoni]|uniref:Uncharacterized protein n=1 Tax=Potamilus streckersoni TaxID=2493646 RepID=A0AAE0T4K2_9BIVA|nr:hypothetical protein CHS0354_027882 [Potamilus streckersoni]
MVCCGSASAWAKVACMMLVIALPLHIAGYATVYWLTVYTVNENYVAGIGLWKMENCSSNAYSSPCKTNIDVPGSYQNGMFLATQALETVAVPFLVFSTLFSLLYVFVRRLRTLCLTITVVILCFLTALLSFIGMILHVTNIPSNHYVSYSFGLTVVALLLTFFAGVLMYANIRRYELPDSDVIFTAPAPEKLNQDEVKIPRYYNEYGKESDRDTDIYRNKDKGKYSREKKLEAYYHKHRTDVLHYHSNNREISEKDWFLPSPPSYRSVETPLSIGTMSRMTDRTERTLRSHLQTPDIYLESSALTDVDQPGRY